MDGLKKKGNVEEENVEDELVQGGINGDGMVWFLCLVRYLRSINYECWKYRACCREARMAVYKPQ